MAASPSLMEPSSDADKLSHEIFSILESKFLFGYDDPNLFLSSYSPDGLRKSPARPAKSLGKVRILSIDASGDGLFAAASLTHLESSIRRRFGDPAARIADFFDVAAGSGSGGALAAMLFTRGPDGFPLFSAEEALCFLSKNGSQFAGGWKGLFGRIFRRSGRGLFRRIFGDSTLRDAVKPLLIPCYDLSTGAPFLFSRADAMETEAYDFLIKEICAASCTGNDILKMKSIDGRTRIAALGGGLAMANPTAAAITHVLHNKQEFPYAAGVEDLLVVSISGGDIPSAGSGACISSPARTKLLKIAENGMADTVRRCTLSSGFLQYWLQVDQAVAMAFSQNRTNNGNYVRVQAYGIHLQAPKASKRSHSKNAMAIVDEILGKRSVESGLFHGKRLSTESVSEKLERFACELVEERERRIKSPIPTVLLKQTTTPRISSATTVTSAAASNTTTTDSP
ncbi:Patatin group A-3 [Apostasia shenzhenica]|uniref:Patatin group A-3 n=1 Tax=Apostasia shenzhenica TaxID=1088818 RepID=A0A2I0B2F6_9ASPA|nr:Patatin group A-3 [Apostasia shenzhenica]